MFLPPEVWSQIVLNIPSSHVSPLLHVSRMFHEFAIAILFSAIKIYFIGGHSALQMLNTFHEDFVQDTVEKLMTTSWALLRHITRLPSFAKVVRSITVVAFADSQSIFEQRISFYLGMLLMHYPTYKHFAGLVRGRDYQKAWRNASRRVCKH